MKTIQTDDLQKMMSEHPDLAVINTLPEEAAKDANIPGTPNVPLENDDFVERVERHAGGKSQPVVVYCAGKDCDVSEKAGKKLEESGFANVYDYEGGATAWRMAGTTAPV